MVKRGETKTKEFQRISQLMRTLPTLQVDDPEFIRIKYLRYADDVRHLTHNEILLTEKEGSEENDLRVISPT